MLTLEVFVKKLKAGGETRMGTVGIALLRNLTGFVDEFRFGMEVDE